MAKNYKLTPKGTAKWPKVTEPDYEYKDEGEYSIKLIWPADSDEAKQMMALVDELMEESAEKAAEEAKKKSKGKRKPKIKVANPPYRPEVRKEEDEDGDEIEVETGNMEFTFKCAASGVSKKTGKAWERKIPLFDSAGTPMPEDTELWGGSQVRVSFDPYLWYTKALGAGVKLTLGAVQVIELSSGAARTASDFGFGQEEGGYTVGSMTEGSEDEGYDDDAEGVEGEEDF